MLLKFNRLHDEATLPSRQHYNDAGLDLHVLGSRSIAPKEIKVYSTGFGVEIPDFMVGLVVPRSGLAFKKGVTLTNSPGIIDSGYRGELKVSLVNHGREMVRISHGDRVAQLLLIPIALPEAVEAIEEERGEGGFGSTGS